MNVQHISTRDIDGGAARAAYRLHVGLRSVGIESAMLVRTRSSDDLHVTSVPHARSLAARITRRIRAQSLARDRSLLGSRPTQYRDYGMSDDRSLMGRALGRSLGPCDILNLHWVAGFIDYAALFGRGPIATPMVWTLHDMNPFTGGCHYDDGCGRYQERCGLCPMLESRSEADVTRRIWLRKRRALASVQTERLIVVGDSRWLASEAQRSSLLGRFRVEAVHYGVDTEDFRPHERVFARNFFGLPPEDRIVLFVAESTSQRRKGAALLERALAIPGKEKLTLATVGRGRVVAPVPVHTLGYLRDDRVLALAYSAADVVVVPSLQEAFGQTALESIACGTPVAAFAVGGLPEIVRPGETGALAHPADPGALAAAIQRLLSMSAAERERMSRRCREAALEEFTLERQARNYVDLYGQLLDRARVASRGAADVSDAAVAP